MAPSSLEGWVQNPESMFEAGVAEPKQAVGDNHVGCRPPLWITCGQRQTVWLARRNQPMTTALIFTLAKGATGASHVRKGYEPSDPGAALIPNTLPEMVLLPTDE
jgi:hypothetical protein